MKSPISDLIATWCYLGKMKFMPGTWGSLGAFPLIFGLHFAFDTTHFMGKYLFMLSLSALIVFLYWIGVKATHHYLLSKFNNLKADPGEVVIDEVVGQLITCLIYCGFVWGLEKSVGSWNGQWPLFLGRFSYFLPAFIAFRFFDILKIWPISVIDRKIKGPHGVMLDDVLAGVFAGITLCFGDIIQSYWPAIMSGGK
jgi:phosphatidylglycerophosphatase A